MSGIYDDGATYGPNPDAQTNDAPVDPTYDDTCDHGYTQHQKCTGCMAEYAQREQRTRNLFAK